MKSILVLCLLASVLFAAPQDPPGILSGTFSTPTVAMNRVGDNLFTLTYSQAFNSVPYFGLAITKMTSIVSTRYVLIPKIVARTTSNINLNIYTPFNTWINLAYSWVASVSPALSVIQFSNFWPTNAGVANKAFPASSINIPPGTVKIDTLIAGFNYGASSNLFNIKVQPQGAVTLTANSTTNQYGDSGVTNNPFNGFFVQSGTNITFPYIVTYDTTAVQNFPELVITLVIHSVSFPTGTQSPVTSGFNTATTTQQTSYINLFNPVANKNNLGVPTAQQFFGFSQISLTPPAASAITPMMISAAATTTGGIDIQVIVNTPFNSSIYSMSTINTVSASYYFYENNALSICPVSNTPSNSLISSSYNNWLCRTVNSTQATSSCQPYSGTQDTYSVSISNPTPVSLYIDVSTTIGTTYMITFYLLDGGANFANPQLTVRLGTQTVSRIVSTNSSIWKSSSVTGIPGDPQIQSLGSYVQFTIFATATQSVSRLQFEFADQTTLPTLHTYYLKAVSMTSGNTIYNPTTQTCVSSCLNNQMISSNTVPNVCTSCPDQGRIYDPATGSCGCPTANYFNPTTLSCTRCLEPTCERCNPNNPATCTSCSVNRVLSGNRCVCANGYLEVNGVCVVCNPGCTSCTANPNICISCQPNSNRIQANGTCSCVSGFYDAGQVVCAPCPVSCLTCTNAQTAVPTPACSQCPANSNRVSIPVNNDCPCLPGFTERANRGQTCQSCHFSCATCIGPSSSECSSCNFFANRIYSPSNAGGMCVCARGFTDVGLPYCTNGTACTNIPGCVACNNGACTQCDSSQFKVFNTTQNKCVCMVGYFQSTNSIINSQGCFPCAVGCSQCSSAETCSQCYTGATNTPIGCQCPSGTYPDRFTASCQRCVGGCQTCSSQFNCISCFSPLTLTQNTCACPQGSYLVGNICQNCPPLCQSCNGTGQCVLCQNGFLIVNGTCVNSCPARTYSDGYSCTACPVGCQTCSGSSTCQSCVASYIFYSGLCLTSCPDGTVASTTAPIQCVPCSSNCQRCVGTPTTCTSCLSSQVLLNNACASYCSPGSVSISGSCVPCSSACQTCFGGPSICTSCNAGLVLFPLGQCVTSCPAGTYYQSGARCYPFTSCPAGTFYNGSTCANCSPLCATCSGSSTNCTSCNRSPPYLQVSTCTASCSLGYYLYENMCLQCDLSCAECFSGAPTNCSVCAAGYTMGSIQGLCIPTCIGNSFNNGTACQACPNTCAGCINSASCIACASTSAVLVNGQCTSCASPCLTCVSGSSSACTSCVTNTFLSGTSCVSICPIGQNPVNGICACSTGFTYQSQCVTTCPSMTTVVNNICQPCTAHCSSCFGSPTNCTQCAVGYNLIGSNCVQGSTCPYGQVPNQNTFCVSICPAGLLFYDTYCVSSCPTNFVPNSARSGCVFANSSIQRQCAVGLVYYNGLCLSSCPVGTYPNSGSCINCVANCAYCTSATVCLSCQSGYYISPNGICILSTTCAPPQITFQGGCITSCPTGTYQQAFTCNRICEVGTYYYNGLCYYQNCPSGLYRSEFSCVSTCPNGTTLTNGSCIGSSTTTCPTGSYLTVSGGCAACQIPCASCFGTPNTCTSCITGTLNGNNCTTSGGSGPSLILTIQSSSIYNNRVQVKILLSNLPITLTQSQLNQLINVVVFPNTQPPASVYQWPETGTSNIINVVIVFPSAIVPTTTIYFSLNVPAVGNAFNQQGITNFSGATVQLSLANVPRASAMFSIPAEASPTAAMSPTTTNAK